MQKNLSMFQNCKDEKLFQMELQFDFKSRANTAQIDFMKIDQNNKPKQMKKYYHNNHSNIDLITNESFASPKYQNYKNFDFDQIINDNQNSTNSNYQIKRHIQKEFRMSKDKLPNYNKCNPNMKSQKNLRIQIHDQPSERNQYMIKKQIPLDTKIQKEIKQQYENVNKLNQKCSQSPDIRPQTNIGRQRAKATFSTLAAKLPLIINLNSAPLTVQSTKHANQIKNVQQLQSMNKNIGLIQTHFNVNKQKEEEIKQETPPEIIDNKENIHFHEDKKKNFFNIVFNSKRELKNDQIQNNINFKTNLDKEFLNMFVLDF